MKDGVSDKERKYICEKAERKKVDGRAGRMCAATRERARKLTDISCDVSRNSRWRPATCHFLMF